MGEKLSHPGPRSNPERDGKVAEEGHHDDLLARGGTYADLWHVQSGDLMEPVAKVPGGA